MNIRQNFLDTFAWAIARRAPDAPPRPSFIQKAYWSDAWERIRQDAVMSALGALVYLCGLAMAIFCLVNAPVALDLDGERVSWQGLSLGLCVLAMFLVVCIERVRQGQRRRDSGEYVPGSAAAGAIYFLSLGSLVLVVQLIVTLGYYIPSLFGPALKAGLWLIAAWLLATAAMLAFQAVAFCVRFCRSREQGKANRKANSEMPHL